MMRATRKGGMVTIISIWEEPVQLHPNDIVLDELNISGPICYPSQDFSDTIDMMADDRI